MRTIRFVLGVTGLLLAFGCGDTIVNLPSPTDPTPVTPPVITSKIEFRVTGNAVSVRVRYSNERDGLVQTITTLPFFTSFNTTSDNLFLSLDVTPLVLSGTIENPFLSAQIFANGNLFREATSTSFFLSPISVDGTWRR